MTDPPRSLVDFLGRDVRITYEKEPHVNEGRWIGGRYDNVMTCAECGALVGASHSGEDSGNRVLHEQWHARLGLR